MSFEQVEKLVRDNKVEWVDLRFADLRGVHHAVSYPGSIIDASLFDAGRMFDGCSITIGPSLRSRPVR